jgi:hypothetical protein
MSQSVPFFFFLLPKTHELRNELVEELIPNLGEEMHAELVPRSREVTEIEE